MFDVKYNSVPVVDNTQGIDFGSYWGQDEWIKWYGELVKRYGKKHARWKFAESWTQSNAASGGTFYTNYSRIAQFFKRERIPASPPGSIVTTFSNIWSGLGKVPRIVVNVAGGLALTYGAYKVATTNSAKARTTAEAIRQQLPGAIAVVGGGGLLLAMNLAPRRAKTRGSEYGTMHGNVPYRSTIKFYNLLTQYSAAGKPWTTSNYATVEAAYKSLFPKAYAKLVSESSTPDGKVSQPHFLAEVADISAHWSIEFMDSISYKKAKEEKLNAVLESKFGSNGATAIRSIDFIANAFSPLYAITKYLATNY